MKLPALPRGTPFARTAEMADAHGSGPQGVEVRVRFMAPFSTDCCSLTASGPQGGLDRRRLSLP
jgi:hypothetical protein